MKPIRIATFLVSLIVLFTGCADKIDVVYPGDAYEYGFLYGLLHGFIAPFSLIGMLFGSDVVVFASKNTGFFYALGFLIGSGGWGVFASRSKKYAGK